MKLSCTSGVFAQAFDRGDLTQLEFLDRVAREFECDGVVLDERHFPRADHDYLAQVKKMAADLGLDIAALASDAFFTSDEVEMERLIRLATALGAPLISGRLAAETRCSWAEQLERLGTATKLAKRHNVTLAVRNAPGTFAATSADCRRVTKESDSAWLRFGLEPAAFDAASDTTPLWIKTVLVWSNLGLNPDRETLEQRSYVVLDDPNGTTAHEHMLRAMRAWRTARATFELNRT
jgi:sugar phosphate isomerase/epimerase